MSFWTSGPIYYQNFLTYLDANIYLKAAAIFLAWFLGSKIVYWIIVPILQHLSKNTQTTLDDQIFDFIKNPITLIIAIYGLYFGLKVFPIHTGALDIINNITISIIVVIITYIVIVIVDLFITEWGSKWASQTETTLDDALLPIFHKFSKIVLGIVGFLYVLTVWGVAIGPFLASLGIAGLALGLAMQDTLKNIFGGISLLLDKTYSVDDTIVLESGQLGKVKDIGLRSTKMQTPDGQLLAIPNGVLAVQRVINRKIPEKKTRIEVKFSVAYGSRIKDVRSHLIALIEKNFKDDLVKDDPLVVELLVMGASGLDMWCYFWINKPENKWSVTVKANELVYDELTAKGIAIPFPQMDVHLHDAKKK